jgi:hypothetical protein
MAVQDRGERRKINFSHAVRKKKIDSQYPYNVNHPYYDNLHQYSKNKIHCSCPDCRGKDWSYGENSLEQYKISDRKKFHRLENQLEDEAI